MKKNIKSVSETYICPKKAGYKFRSARKFHTPLYLYGVTGIGKTALILNNVNMKKCSYYSATSILADEINIEKKTTEHTVVIDDLQSLADSSQKEAYFEKIKELLGREDIWLILISRCPFPRWLLPLRAKYIFVEIEEEDFLFSLDEQIVYIEQFGLELSHEQHQAAWSIGGGNPLSLFFYVMENCNLERTIKRQWDYLEVHVYDQWDLQLQEFFMDVSIVEEFTVQLATMLTGRRDVEKLISQAEETGNFFEICGTNGIWRCRWPMRKSMQQRLRRRKTAEQIERLYYSAGLYYEINDQIPEALDMYEKYNDMDSISRLLTANARKNPSGQYCGKQSCSYGGAQFTAVNVDEYRRKRSLVSRIGKICRGTYGKREAGGKKPPSLSENCIATYGKYRTDRYFQECGSVTARPKSSTSGVFCYE